jgi:hypothetical protein
MIDLRYRPLTPFKVLVAGVMAAFFLLGGGALTYLTVQFAMAATAGDPWGLRYLAAALFGLFGVPMVGIGLFALYGFVSLYFDRAIQLSITPDALIDRQCRPPRIIPLAEVVSVDLHTEGLEGEEPHSAYLVLQRMDGTTEQVRVVGLEMEPEDIGLLIERHIGGAALLEPTPCPRCLGSGVEPKKRKRGRTARQRNCPVCHGSGFDPATPLPPGVGPDGPTFQQWLGLLIEVAGPPEVCALCGGPSRPDANVCDRCARALPE